MTSNRFIETDEAEDVAGSVRHALRCAHLVIEDSQAWKWGILALHSALQGACVCHLTKTAAPLGAVTESNAREWTAYFEESRTNPSLKPPKTKLMNLPELLSSVRKPKSAGGFTDCIQVEISDIELDWLKRLHSDIRNQFVHFGPSRWVLEVSGVPRIGQVTARIIKNIHDCGWAFRHLNSRKKKAMVLDLEHLTSAKWQA